MDRSDAGRRSPAGANLAALRPPARRHPGRRRARDPSQPRNFRRSQQRPCPGRGFPRKLPEKWPKTGPSPPVACRSGNARRFSGDRRLVGDPSAGGRDVTRLPSRRRVSFQPARELSESRVLDRDPPRRFPDVFPTGWGRGLLGSTCASCLRSHVRCAMFSTLMISTAGTRSTDELPRLDIREAARRPGGVHVAGAHLRVDRAAGVATVAAQGGVHVLELDTTRATLGGRRLWARCPGCCGRFGVLWLDASGPRCRHCAGLRYASTRERCLARACRRRDAARARLGAAPCVLEPVPPRPRGQWHRTRVRLLAAAARADRAVLAAARGSA